MRSEFCNNHPYPKPGIGAFFRMLRDPRWRQAESVSFSLSRNDPAGLKANRYGPTLTWIGHDSFLIQIDGLNLLTDPHFSRQAAPIQFGGLVRRVVAPGLALQDLPRIDIVLISHNHYDHLDLASVRNIARQHPQASFFVPSGLARWCGRQGVTRVHECGWWQSVEEQGCKFHLVPAQHFSSRTPFDRNRSLWGGWVVETPSGKRLYFAGDSGYSSDFKDIGTWLGPMDLSLIPIGAYEPRWFMAPMHVNPEEAVKIHRDVQSRCSVAMHWGTFRLTPEPMDEPPKRLSTALAQAGIPPEQFRVMRHGETCRLDAATGTLI